MTNIEYFASKKWGIFHHFLSRLQGNVQMPHNQGLGELPWTEIVDKFDVEKLAFSLHQMNVGYYFITLMQGTNAMLAPNATYDCIAGTKPGEACAHRDLPTELFDALSKYNIDLCLYFTGDGPWTNDEIGGKFGFVHPRKNISMDFCKKWSSVLAEYADRYGDKVKAWWIDGCYRDYFGYTEEMYELYHNAIISANPNALVGFNDGVKQFHTKNYSKETLICGEFIGFDELPRKGIINGALAHTLAPLGYNPVPNDYGWGAPGIRHPEKFMADYIKAVNTVGGVVSIDAMCYADGSFDPEQEATLLKIGQMI